MRGSLCGFVVLLTVLSKCVFCRPYGLVTRETDCYIAGRILRHGEIYASPTNPCFGLECEDGEHYAIYICYAGAQPMEEPTVAVTTTSSTSSTSTTPTTSTTKNTTTKEITTTAERSTIKPTAVSTTNQTPTPVPMTMPTPETMSPPTNTTESQQTTSHTNESKRSENPKNTTDTKMVVTSALSRSTSAEIAYTNNTESVSSTIPKPDHNF